MASVSRSGFGLFINEVPAPKIDNIKAPEPTFVRPQLISEPDGRQSGPPSNIELDKLQWGRRMTGPDDLPFTESNPPAELEGNTDGDTQRIIDHHIAPVDAAQTIFEPFMNRWRAASCCLAFFIQGFNDSVPGALLPYMERYYHASYSLISLIFIANAMGFIAAGPLTHFLNNRFGRAKVLSCCMAINALAYVALICQPPFPVVIIAFLVLGFGFATILSLDNVFIINLSGGTEILGYMHGCYGIGGVVAPLVATAMISGGARWSFAYILPLSLSVVDSGFFFWAFKNYEKEIASTRLLTALERTASRASTLSQKKSVLWSSLKNRTTLLGALLIFAYQGAEVSISGWVISFLIDYRNGDPRHVGYVTSGFWGGITLGRFVLVRPMERFGARVSLLILVVLTAGLQMLVWFLPNVIGNAVAVALIGVLLGPVYPVAAGTFAKLIRKHLQITSLGFIAGVGSSGGAMAPFLTGILAQKFGTVVLNPVCVVLDAIVIVAWLALPRVEKRKE